MLTQLVRKARKIIVTSAAAKDVRNSFYLDRIYCKRMEKLFSALNGGIVNETVTKTAYNVNPLGLKFGLTAAAVKKHLGAEKFLYNNHHSKHNITVLFYKRSYADLSFLVQLQFYNNQLYFVGLDVMRRLIEPAAQTTIINKVLDRYLPTPYLPKNGFPIITDSANNAILINDDINFSVCYLSGETNIARQQCILTGLKSVTTAQA